MAKQKFEFITSWDDYSDMNIFLANLLKKYNIPAIFFIECNEDRKLDQMRELDAMGFTIGCHSETHPEDLKLLSDDQLEKEITEAKYWCQSAIGKEVDWYCPPSGRFNDRVIKFIMGAGYKYYRTVAVLNTEHVGKKMQVNPTIHVYPDRREYEGKDWLELAKSLFKLAQDTKGYFHLWGHANEINKFKQWEKLEEFFKFVIELINPK